MSIWIDSQECQCSEAQSTLFGEVQYEGRTYCRKCRKVITLESALTEVATDGVEKWPAGWYADPQSPDEGDRYWDGDKWTGGTRGISSDRLTGAPRQYISVPSSAQTDDPSGQNGQVQRRYGLRRKRNRDTVTSLKDKGGKWRKALSGQGLASFSLVGTQDWEDYASASMIAMLLDTVTDLEERAEASEYWQNSVESQLRQIVDLLSEIRYELSKRSDE